MKVEIGGQRFEVRGLKRKEIKALRREGFPLETIGGLDDIEKRDEGLDRIFSLACSGGDPDSLTQGEALELWARVVEATYGTEVLKKKSAPRRRSSSAESGSTARSAGAQGSRPKGTARRSQRESG
ncbi:MAG: hypothetical protein JRJ66_01445 [Deltaproteobacteria bacterium]|nr:hypothetical protein [Deltaproteobacteria bacterium]MBW2081690.1 hypothetical protein [Deltaproteobacteria bacterium]MBW2298885.1 hypothetical protein [Deltaproteobacteria bacterium]